MLLLKIILGLLFFYLVFMFSVLGIYKIIFSKIQITMNEIGMCVNKMDYLREYLTKDRYQIGYELGSENAAVIIRYFNRLTDLINRDKDYYFAGEYFTNKNTHKNIINIYYIKEMIRCVKYRKIFSNYNRLIFSLIELISLEKRYRLKEKEVVSIYLSLKTKLLKDLREIVV